MTAPRDSLADDIRGLVAELRERARCAYDAFGPTKGRCLEIEAADALDRLSAIIERVRAMAQNYREVDADKKHEGDGSWRVYADEVADEIDAALEAGP